LADLLGDDLASAHHSKKLSGESQVDLHFEGQESRGPEEYFNILQPPHPTIRATCLVDAQQHCLQGLQNMAFQEAN